MGTSFNCMYHSLYPLFQKIAYMYPPVSKLLVDVAATDLSTNVHTRFTLYM